MWPNGRISASSSEMADQRPSTLCQQRVTISFLIERKGGRGYKMHKKRKPALWALDLNPGRTQTPKSEGCRRFYSPLHHTYVVFIFWLLRWKVDTSFDYIRVDRLALTRLCREPTLRSRQQRRRRTRTWHPPWMIHRVWMFSPARNILPRAFLVNVWRFDLVVRIWSSRKGASEIISSSVATPTTAPTTKNIQQDLQIEGLKCTENDCSRFVFVRS